MNDEIFVSEITDEPWGGVRSLEVVEDRWWGVSMILRASCRLLLCLCRCGATSTLPLLKTAAVLERLRPLPLAKPTPAHGHAFVRAWALQGLSRTEQREAEKGRERER